MSKYSLYVDQNTEGYDCIKNNQNLAKDIGFDHMNPSNNMEIAINILFQFIIFWTLLWSVLTVWHIISLWLTSSGLILGLRPANVRHRCKVLVTPSLIGWVQT